MQKNKLGTDSLGIENQNGGDQKTKVKGLKVNVQAITFQNQPDREFVHFHINSNHYLHLPQPLTSNPPSVNLSQWIEAVLPQVKCFSYYTNFWAKVCTTSGQITVKQTRLP